MSKQTEPSRPRKDQERNRAALIEAAYEVFAEQGVDAPLDAIAKRAGLANATLYRHFADRSALIAEVLQIGLTRNDDALTAALEQPEAWDGLTEYLKWNFAEQIENPAQLSALRALPVGQYPDTDLLRYRTVEKLESLFERAKQQRSIRVDRWVEDIYLLMSANEQVVQADRSDPRAASDRLLELALAALRLVPAPESAVETPVVLRLRATIGIDLGGLPARAVGDSPTQGAGIN